jgi:hypothetical protein
VATNTTGICPAAFLAGTTEGVPEATITYTPSYQLRGGFGHLDGALRQCVFDNEVSAFQKAKVAQPLPKAIYKCRRWWAYAQEANARDLSRFHRAPREWPPCGCAAEQHNELPPLYLITSPVRTRGVDELALRL